MDHVSVPNVALQKCLVVLKYRATEDQARLRRWNALQLLQFRQHIPNRVGQRIDLDRDPPS